MSDIDGKPGVPGEEKSTRPEPEAETLHEEEISRLLRLAGPRPAAGPGREERVRAAVHASWRAEVAGRQRLVRVLRIALPAAAAALVIAAFGLVRWLPRHTPGMGPGPLAVLERAQGLVWRGDDGAVAAGAEFRSGDGIVTGAGGRAALRLSNGVSIRLDSGTRLLFHPGAVLDLGQGAVYVDSGPAKGGLLTVRTPLGAIRDIGTQFEVRLRDGGVDVTVREGTASLHLKESDLPVEAGIRLTADASGEISRTAVPSDSPDWDWVLEIAAPYDLEGRTLESFLAWVARETGWQVRFSDAATGRERAAIVLHGSLEGLRPDEAPAAILPTCGLTSRLEDGVLVIESLEVSPALPDPEGLPAR